MHPAYVSHTSPGPSATTAPASPEKARAWPKKSLPGRFAPNCGESTISVGRSLGLAHDFRGRGVQCGLASDPVAARDRVEGAHRGCRVFRMLTDARCCSLMPFCFSIRNIARPADFCSNIFARVLLPGLLLAFGSGHPNPFVGPNSRLDPSCSASPLHP